MDNIIFRDYLKEISVAKKIAFLAEEIMLEYFDIDQQVQIKDDRSSVTIADTLVNRITIEELHKEFPEDGVIGEEESTSDYGAGRKWFCDPIDGTGGYIWGTPTAMFSLGLVVDGTPILGVTYDPFLKRMYLGVKGQGSYCNNKKLAVSEKNLEGSTVAITSNPIKILKYNYIKKLKEKEVDFAVFSGAVYKSSLVAKGKIEGYIEHGVNGHDMAAIQVIVEEAGGKVTGLHGEILDYTQPFKGAVVSNGKIHDEFVSIISGREF